LDQSIRGRVMNTSCPTLSFRRLATLRRSSSRFVRVRGLCVPRRFSVYPVFPTNPRHRDSPPHRLSCARAQRLSLGVEKLLHVTTASLRSESANMSANQHKRVDCIYDSIAQHRQKRNTHESEWVNVPCVDRTRTTHHFHSPFTRSPTVSTAECVVHA